MDLTEKWKLRVGVRQDWYDNELDPLVTVPNATTGLPSAFTNTGVPIIAGVPLFRDDKPLSWSVGTLYHLTPWMAPYIGASQSYLTNFNSENTHLLTSARRNRRGNMRPASASRFSTKSTS